MAKSNSFDIVKIQKIGQSNAAKLPKQIMLWENVQRLKVMSVALRAKRPKKLDTIIYSDDIVWTLWENHKKDKNSELIRNNNRS